MSRPRPQRRLPHRAAFRTAVPVACWAVLVATAAACSGPGQEEGRPLPPLPGNPAPAWEGRTLEGETLALADLRGDVVVLNVWATWCAPCLREMPGLDALSRHFEGQGLRVLGVSVDRGSAQPDVESFSRDLGISFTILLDPDQRVMNRFRTLGVPETFLIGRDGVIAHRWIGEFDPMDPGVLARVEALLAEAHPAG
jgi:cytochrome c biogenesis protein CcmG, thiol:disulfide interchange protein DsbE